MAESTAMVSELVKAVIRVSLFSSFSYQVSENPLHLWPYFDLLKEFTTSTAIGAYR